MLALAVAATLTCAQIPVTIFRPEGLGDAAWETFQNPESITVQSIYPANRGEKIERQFGPLPIRFVGKPIRLAPQHWKTIIANFSNPVGVMERNCTFHADHHVVFKDSKHTVEAISCFTCDELAVIVDGQYKGRCPMGLPKQFRNILTSTVPISDSVRSAAEEFLTREFLDALSAAPKASIQFLKLSALTKPDSPFSVQKIGGPVIMSGEFALLLKGELEHHSMNRRLSFRAAQPAGIQLSPNPVLIEFTSKPPMSLLLYSAYGRAELFAGRKHVRQIDLFGIEDRMQKLIARVPKK